MCLLHAKDNKAVANSDLESFDSNMVALSIFNEIWKKSVMFASERDMSCYIFQNISITKLVVIHEKIPGIPDIVANRW